MIDELEQIHNPNIPLPYRLYGGARVNSRGWDITDLTTLEAIQRDREKLADKYWRAQPLLASETLWPPRRSAFAIAKRKAASSSMIRTLPFMARAHGEAPRALLQASTPLPATVHALLLLHGRGFRSPDHHPWTGRACKKRTDRARSPHPQASW